MEVEKIRQLALEIGFNYDGGWVTVTIKDTIL